ncbi:15152_t:CDS:2 [Cetraspora pellucida]|uniref:15152_t:CDS:1 n=1 Tax=Cetraspora pellucida TaxID=1433469 RepID=A0A9N9GYJ9_9GLOM|nr:15152_t:CDS:2 [Cetraspora pellucida]
MEIVIFAGIIISLYISYFYFHYFTRPNPLPGPFPFPFIGTLFQIGVDPCKWGEKNLNDSIDLWEFYVGPFRVITIRDAKYLDKIYLSYNEAKNLSKESKFFKRNTAAYDEVGILNGIVLNSVYHKWKRSRQFVTKVLMSKKYHYGFINSVQNIFKEYEVYWDENKEVTLDFSTWVYNYKAQVSVMTVIGQQLYNLPSLDLISKAASEYIAMFAFLVFVPKIVSRILMLIGFNTMKKRSIFLNGTIKNVVQKRREEIENGSPTNFNLLDLLLTSNLLNDSESIKGEEPFTNEEVVTNLAEITATSIETTSSALCFLVYNVAQNPSVIEKIRAEILKVFGPDTNTIITYETLGRCHYIEAAIKEALRITSPVPYNLRILDGEESVGKFHWPSGTWFWINHHRIMNDPNNFNEPKKFNPDRFLDEEYGGTGEFKNIPKNVYAPFGGGLRICPGKNIALIELKLITVLLFRKYNINLVNGSESIKYGYRSAQQMVATVITELAIL